MSKKILISGYNYVNPDPIKTFDYYPSKKGIFFLAPKSWSYKKGANILKPPEQENVYKARAFFYHSNYPIIGGVLKGWMPIFPFVFLKIKPDIVFSASEPNLLTTLYQGIYTKLFGAKHIIFSWENVPYEKKFKGFKGFIQKIIIKLNLLFCDGLICGSVRTGKIIRMITNKPTAVIPTDGVDTDFLRCDRSGKSFQSVSYENFIVFCFIGSISYRKGIHLIVKAFERVSKEVSNVRLIIAGSGEYEKTIDSEIENSESKSSIQRIPWLDRIQVRKLLNASDIFVYPSIPYGGWEEQFGYSMAEASSMELPVIATQSGSIPEIVVDNKTGILVKPDNVDQLSEAMVKLAKNENLRRKMGQEGREYIVKNFSNPVIARKFYEFFNKF